MRLEIFSQIRELFAQILVGQDQMPLLNKKGKEAYQLAEFFHFPGSLRIAADYS
jgi:hypothetical protein